MRPIGCWDWGWGWSRCWDRCWSLRYAIVISWSHVTSHVIVLTRSGQFQIIAPEVDLVISHLTYLINLPTFGSIFRINLSNQPFESTFRINHLNKPTQSAFSLNRRHHWLVVRCFLQTYVRRIVLLPTEVRMIQVVDLLADHPLVEVWNVSPSSTPWWRCGWKPC